MKRIISLFILPILFLGLFGGCSNQRKLNSVNKNEQFGTTEKQEDIRKIAYDQLTSKDKERISGTWQESKLSKVTLSEGIGNISDKSYIGKEVYLIDF